MLILAFAGISIPPSCAQAGMGSALSRPEGAAPAAAASSPNVPQAPLKRPNDLRRDEVEATSLGPQTMEPPWYHLRGKARIETTEVRLTADEIDYNRETGDAEARGNVHFERFGTEENLWADRVDYNVADETGKFYNVRGSSPLDMEVRPGILKTTSPFYFEGRWAERIRDRYILHDGFVTNCKMPKPWWILKAPTFDIIPKDRAIAHRSVFWLKKVPLLYAPTFYKSLEDQPRKSGLLTPNIGNSSRRGKMVGVGYYWAINRSYDATYRAQLFTQRGVAHHVDLRGKPSATSDFNFILYGVNDRGELQADGISRVKQGGYLASFEGKAELGRGFYARVDANYLSSFSFRQAFTESFNEAIASEVNAIGYIAKQWSYNSLTILASRSENFQSAVEGDTIVIRKLPEVRFNTRDRMIWDRGIPIWVSLDSSAGLLRRSQPLFQTRPFMERLDFQPRIMTALRWKDFSLIPSFSLLETRWGSSQIGDRLLGSDIQRNAREFSVALVPPSLERIYNSPKWLGDKIKHVIEPRVSYRKVSGVRDFNSLIRFDETELLSNTSEAEISLINRFYVKRGSTVDEMLTWQLTQQRYFDPSFGGAVVAGRRNIVLSSSELTPYAFLDGPRRYSPVVSILRVNPKPGFGVEWRADYDPLRGKFVNSGVTVDFRHGIYGLSARHLNVSPVMLSGPALVKSSDQPADFCRPALGQIVPLLSPCSNQFSTNFSVGHDNRRGWNGAFSEVYDFRLGTVQWVYTTVTYNTDCCGFSLQYRRFGPRGENQYMFAFTVANIGSFGTLKKQEKLF